MTMIQRVSAVGQLVWTLPEAEPVRGVATLNNSLYVLRDKTTDQLEIYDTDNYRLQRRLTLTEARGFADLTSCDYYQQLYMSDPVLRCVHRLDARYTAKIWSVNEVPDCLSVSVVRNLLVTCCEVHKIKEFSSSGNYLRDIQLPGSVVSPRHAVESRTGGFIVCHGTSRSHGDPVHRVCKISEDGRRVVQSHGGRRGSTIDQFNRPHHLALDDSEYVFVADVFNRRVTLLSPTLHYFRPVVTRDDLKRWPGRLCLDVQRQRLYVTDNEVKEDRTPVGRVVVFNVWT